VYMFVGGSVRGLLVAAVCWPLILLHYNSKAKGKNLACMVAQQTL
jgi:hypothetical protein